MSNGAVGRLITGRVLPGLIVSVLVFGIFGCDSGGSDPQGAPDGPAADEQPDYGSPDSGSEVPDVTGEDAATATTDLEDVGLTAAYDYTEPDDPSLCTVSDQDVTAGEPAEEGDTVTLTVACAVPDLSGVLADDAKAQLEGFGFEAAYATEPNDTTVCTVASQDPAVDEEIDQGEMVTLTVECDVPSVTGEDAETAAGEIEDAGFTSSYDFEPSDPYACTVDSQDTEGQAELGTEVALQLSCDDDDGY